jgi:hypothetical protein
MIDINLLDMIAANEPSIEDTAEAVKLSEIQPPIRGLAEFDGAAEQERPSRARPKRKTPPPRSPE